MILLDLMVEKQVATNRKDASVMIGFNHSDLWKPEPGDGKPAMDQTSALCKITGARADVVSGFTNEICRKPGFEQLAANTKAVDAFS